MPVFECPCLIGAIFNQLIDDLLAGLRRDLEPEAERGGGGAAAVTDGKVESERINREDLRPWGESVRGTRRGTLRHTALPPRRAAPRRETPPAAGARDTTHLPYVGRSV